MVPYFYKKSLDGYSTTASTTPYTCKSSIDKFILYDEIEHVNNNTYYYAMTEDSDALYDINGNNPSDVSIIHFAPFKVTGTMTEVNFK